MDTTRAAGLGLLDAAVRTGKEAHVENEMPSSRQIVTNGGIQVTGRVVGNAVADFTEGIVARKAGEVVADRAIAQVVSRMATEAASTQVSATTLGQATADGFAYVMARQTSVQVLGKTVAGAVGGGVVGPAIEVLRLKLDKEEHTGAEYAAAAGRGLAISGTGGAVGALVGSIVPGPGTLIGWAAGTGASLLVGWLLES